MEVPDGGSGIRTLLVEGVASVAVYGNDSSASGTTAAVSAWCFGIPVSIQGNIPHEALE